MAAFEIDGSAGLGLDDVAIFRGDGVDAEVPDTEVDFLIGDDLHESVLTEAEGLAGGDLHPVIAGEKLRGGFDDVLLALNAAEESDTEAGDDARVGADIGADDDVAAIWRAA